MESFKVGEYPRYEVFIRQTAAHYAIPRNLLEVTLWQASQYDPDKIAGKGRHATVGVRGIASLTPENASGLWHGNGDRRTDPFASIVGAARILAHYKQQFSDWRLALLAYHSSPDIVRDALHKGAEMPIDAHRYAEQAMGAADV